MPYIAIKDKTIVYLETLFFFLNKSKKEKEERGAEKREKREIERYIKVFNK